MMHLGGGELTIPLGNDVRVSERYELDTSSQRPPSLRYAVRGSGLKYVFKLDFRQAKVSPKSTLYRWLTKGVTMSMPQTSSIHIEVHSSRLSQPGGRLHTDPRASGGPAPKQGFKNCFASLNDCFSKPHEPPRRNESASNRTNGPRNVNG